MIASSTSRPSANTSVPSDTLCNPMPNRYMHSDVAASTRGIEITTTMPVRAPRLMRLTINTIPIASATASMKSLIERDTACGMRHARDFGQFEPCGQCRLQAPRGLPQQLTEFDHIAGAYHRHPDAEDRLVLRSEERRVGKE